MLRHRELLREGLTLTSMKAHKYSQVFFRNQSAWTILFLDLLLLEGILPTIWPCRPSCRCMWRGVSPRGVTPGIRRRATGRGEPIILPRSVGIDAAKKVGGIGILQDLNAQLLGQIVECL